MSPCLSLRNSTILISMVQIIGHIFFVIVSCMISSGFLFAYLTFSQGSAVVEGEASKIQNLTNVTPVPVPVPTPSTLPGPPLGLHSMTGDPMVPESQLIQNLNNTDQPTVPPIPIMPYVLEMIISLTYYSLFGLVGLFLAILLLVAVIKPSHKLLMAYIFLKSVHILMDLAACIASLYQYYPNTDLVVEKVLMDATSVVPMSKILDQIFSLIQSLWPWALTIYEAGVVWSILNVLFLIVIYFLYKKFKMACVRGSVTSQSGSVYNYNLSQMTLNGGGDGGHRG